MTPLLPILGRLIAGCVGGLLVLFVVRDVWIGRTWQDFLYTCLLGVPIACVGVGLVVLAVLG